MEWLIDTVNESPVIFIALTATLALLVAYWGVSSFRNMVGRQLTRLALFLALPRNWYMVFNDIDIPLSLEENVRFAHVVLSPFGLFAIETEDCCGTVSGRADDSQWHYRHYGYTRTADNPLRLHRRHADILTRLLELEKLQVFPVAVFTATPKFKESMPDQVTGPLSCISYIRRFRNEIFTQEEINRLADNLGTNRLALNWRAGRAHQLYVQSIHDQQVSSEWSANFAEGTSTGEYSPSVISCPECGSAMVLRLINHDKKRSYQCWCCTNYPKCRMTVNID